MEFRHLRCFLATDAFAMNPDGFNTNTCCQVRLASSRTSNEDHVVRRLGELHLVQIPHQGFVDLRFIEGKAGQIPMCRESCRSHLICH